MLKYHAPFKLIAIPLLALVAQPLFAQNNENDIEHRNDQLEALVQEFHLENNQRRVVEVNTEFMYVNIEGQNYLISKNGRYVIRGQITDAWRDEDIQTIADMRYSETHVSLDYWDLDVNNLNTISIGYGPNEAIVFVDPRCPSCKRFIESALERQAQYTTKIIVVPAFGGPSVNMSRSLFCSEDRINAIDALMSQSLLDLPQRPNCDRAGLDTTLMAATVLNIQAVPYIIAPDGRFTTGYRDDIWRWMAGDS